MSIYTVNGSEISTLYRNTGTPVSNAYDVNGNEIASGGTGGDYHSSILQARNAWESAYKADADIIPLILTTDQHGYMNAAHGKSLYDYLSQNIDWSDVSASLNLGDVCPSVYGASTLDTMQLALSAIPAAKQINVAGNHDVTGITDDDTAMDDMFDTYFNNSLFSGSSRFQHRGFETMIDELHGVRYICIGSWDFTDGVYYHYNISTESLAWLIDTLEAVDNYDVIILSHIQPSVGSLNRIYPAVDGKTHRVVIEKVSGTSSVGYNTPIDQILLARKNKTSGTITDASGVIHTYDFSSCTSDLLCSLHGHSHVDWYNYLGGIPSIVFDAYRYDDKPFYFVNVDKNNDTLDAWKVGESGEVQKYTVPFTEHVNPCTGITLDKHEMTIAIDETATLTPSFATEFQDDGTYPQWRATWSVRVGSTLSSAVASVDNGVVTGNSPGVCTVYAYCGDLRDTCTVTVTDSYTEGDIVGEQ